MSEIFAAAPARTTDDAVLELQRESESQHLERAGLIALLAGGFVAVALGALLLPAERPLSLVALVSSIAAYAVTSRVEVEFPGFVAIPTEAIFVVMWFVLPVRMLPLAVCAAMVLGRLPDVLRGRMPADRLGLTVASCWYSVGPALVLYLAGAGAPRWSNAPILLAALAAQFVFDFVPTYLLQRRVVPLSLVDDLRSAAPAYGFDLVLAPLGLLAAFPAYNHPAALLLLMPMVLIVARVGRERQEKNDKVLELKNAYQGTSYLLGDMIEADDAYTGSHSRDVVELVLAVAERLGLDADEQRMAEFTALLHDVGKIRIAPEIINKPGPLDDEERALMNTHTILGQEMLERAGGLLGEVGPLVRSCHEHWDGKGYPDGLAGEETPLVARIVCTCDAWSAMTTDRSYRRALPHEAALAELSKCAGTQFDPRVVDALLVVLSA
ncbi:MAG TPA: HD-GYP domain-containing protein [Gaiellaceae bacterium]|jgi:HD-GYP domain-containing protein (c-di-GMP phosphodiesterase class II)